ncbi:YesL family protein [Bacillus sp. FSL K6-3431]|uniref:YesL family protein n=1 Tax=Bacillus sp. FSL K6-3431 TaxID=2921500 RepID=UPI0040468EC0
MKLLDSKFYSILESLSNFFLLNLIWILFSLPLITLFPATAAMFAVIRDWKLGKHTSIFIAFLTYFKSNFMISFISGLLFFLFVFIFYIDFTLMDQLGPTMSVLVLSLLFILSLITLSVSIYLFPVIVHFKLSFKNALKNSFLYAVMYFPTTIVSILLLISMALLIFLVPIFSLIAFSVTAYIIFLLCHRSFNKIEALRSVD